MRREATEMKATIIVGSNSIFRKCTLTNQFRFPFVVVPLRRGANFLNHFPVRRSRVIIRDDAFSKKKKKLLTFPATGKFETLLGHRPAALPLPKFELLELERWISTGNFEISRNFHFFLALSRLGSLLSWWWCFSFCSAVSQGCFVFALCLCCLLRFLNGGRARGLSNITVIRGLPSEFGRLWMEPDIHHKGPGTFTPGMYGCTHTQIRNSQVCKFLTHFFNWF